MARIAVHSATLNREPNIPDDNAAGGVITLDFPDDGGKYVYEIGLLDIDEMDVTVNVTFQTKTGFDWKIIPVPRLGDNSFQIVPINTANVRWIKVMLTGSGAVTSFKYCPCDIVTVDFSKAANGTELKGGDYVSNDWLSYGLTLSAEGGRGKLPRLFDTANPGTEEKGDPDLGAPNKGCGGPGIGLGGERGAPGENCNPLGNVLIIQEINDYPEIPDDNAKGGIITLDFTNPDGQYVFDMGLLDIDYRGTTIEVIYRNGGKDAKNTIIVNALGDNSFQKILIDTPNVTWIKVMLRESGAVTYLKFYRKSS